MIEILEEMSLFFGLPQLGVLGIIALSLFLVLGVVGTIIMGRRLGFFWGLPPLLFGVWIGVFPLYFGLVGFVLSLGITFFPESKTMSYQDRIRAVERNDK